MVVSTLLTEASRLQRMKSHPCGAMWSANSRAIFFANELRLKFGHFLNQHYDCEMVDAAKKKIEPWWWGFVDEWTCAMINLQLTPLLNSFGIVWCQFPCVPLVETKMPAFRGITWQSPLNSRPERYARFSAKSFWSFLTHAEKHWSADLWSQIVI